ncbi:hypothetical protein TNCV_1625141 [Trichonephila clavipes]|nr:hypothetical protein TNCV_1625141 [Trichonephila clavipes]
MRECQASVSLWLPLDPERSILCAPPSEDSSYDCGNGRWTALGNGTRGIHPSHILGVVYGLMFRGLYERDSPDWLGDEARTRGHGSCFRGIRILCSEIIEVVWSKVLVVWVVFFSPGEDYYYGNACLFP